MRSDAQRADALASDLRGRLRGEVRFDDGYRALYATDASNYRQVPIGVVLPRDVDDAVEAIEICRAHEAPVVSRGGGTSLAGQACNAAVVLDFSKYVRRILGIDDARYRARVEPGLVLDDLQARARPAHLMFGPDPATHNHCTFGGMIGNNACGVHAMMAGCTADNVEELDILTYDGVRMTVGATAQGELDAQIQRGGRQAELYRGIRDFRDRNAPAIRDRFPQLPRRVSGYNLPALFDDGTVNIARALIGSEGTLATVLAATVRLVPRPRARALLVLGYPSIFEAADHIGEIRASEPIGLEGIDGVLVEDMKRKHLHPEHIELLPDGDGWLLVEFGGDTRRQAEDRAAQLIRQLGRSRSAPRTKLFTNPEEAQTIWTVRESGLGATARVPGEHDTWEGWEDAAVPPERLGSYLREFRRLLDRHGFRAALYGHFGQGCVHTRIPFDLRHREGIREFRAFVEAAAELVVAHGGSLSGEHGDGQARAELLPTMYDRDQIRAFEEWKALWDPHNRMNPGKVVRPNRLDDNLRLGTAYDPGRMATQFRFDEDNGSFSYATERCVGVGECRRTDSGTMCPSYMATREEMHSTRGRAHLLFEMMRADAVRDGFRSETVREALDLCLSCKACKHECPVNVDMARYKSEFLSHYYKRRLRPRSAYAFGLVPWLARVASLAPTVANFVLHAPGLAAAAKWVAGAAPERTLPSFAPGTFRKWWANRATAPTRGRPVLLWVDTWSNHFQPSVGRAAVDVLERAGFDVMVPARAVCCGRPLYDYGMLDLARRTLTNVLDALRPDLRRGVPVVGLEPSCMSAFRDELPALLPDDPDAQRLARQSYMLGDFLLHQASDWTPPRLERRAIVHGHCHHKAVLDFAAEIPLLADMGLDLDVLDAGCCGMAGAFGYERQRYDVSVACAERRLAPAVRAARADTLIIADGFSCREQVEQQTGRRALHTAEVLSMAQQSMDAHITGNSGA